jgi:hypothetical protein
MDGRGPRLVSSRAVTLSATVRVDAPAHCAAFGRCRVVGAAWDAAEFSQYTCTVRVCPSSRLTQGGLRGPQSEIVSPTAEFTLEGARGGGGGYIPRLEELFDSWY